MINKIFVGVEGPEKQNNGNWSDLEQYRNIMDWFIIKGKYNVVGFYSFFYNDSWIAVI